MKVIVSLLAVAALFAVGLLGAAVPGLGWVFGVVLPYLAVAVFLGGLVYRVLGWARVPVPFRIPTTCGQQRSLPWIQQAKVDNPDTALGVAGRMAVEVLFFRSLLRNTQTRIVDRRRLVYQTDLWLWLGALAFHWSLLIVLIRHLRLLTQPVPACVTFLEQTDGFLAVGLPVIQVSSVVFLAALVYLLLRRLRSARLRYISLAADYFPLFLLLGIGLSGFCLRHVVKTDLVRVKELALGLVSFGPTVPASLDPLFYGHLFLVCVLLAYFPFSKLVHMAGVFLSPTRNLANNNRAVRHVNPWDYPVKVHTYAEYEDDLREKMVTAGIPVERAVKSATQ
ncbi:MAG: sulfate reduction electron transfer complex DsrMKJOP subunit DsrM [Planctomycetota bacterium]